MIVAQDRLPLRQHFLVHLCRLCQFSLLSVRRCEVVHARERVRMIVAQDHLSLRQHFLVHLCGLCQFSLLSVRQGEVVHARERGWIVRAAYRGADFDYFL